MEAVSLPQSTGSRQGAFVLEGRRPQQLLVSLRANSPSAELLAGRNDWLRYCWHRSPRTIKASVAKVSEASRPTGRVAPSEYSPSPGARSELDAKGSLSDSEVVNVIMLYRC